jgi:hypothetical protein
MHVRPGQAFQHAGFSRSDTGVARLSQQQLVPRRLTRLAGEIATSRSHERRGVPMGKRRGQYVGKHGIVETPLPAIDAGRKSSILERAGGNAAVAPRSSASREAGDELARVFSISSAIAWPR